MKTQVKQLLIELGLFFKVDLLRRLPEITRWIMHGCTGIAPPPIKRLIIISYLKRFGLNHFIETGTHIGDTLAYIAQDRSVTCTSIELSDEYYKAAVKRFREYRNVSLIQGDSARVLPDCVGHLSGPAVFWLDGHYSGGSTARGKDDTPVGDELQSILESRIKTHVVLIDDARCFDGTNSYPHLHDLLRTIRQQGYYDVEVSADIIRLTPNHRHRDG